LLTDGKAKYEDTVEAVYDAPRELLYEDHRAIHEQGVDYANKRSFALKKAVAEYGSELKAQTDTARAERHFWNALDQQVPVLFDALRNLGTPEFPDADAVWTHACASETPRQIKAFVAGLKRLRFSKLKPKPKDQ